MTQTQAFPDTTQGRFHNPGYTYLMGIYWMKESQVYLSSEETRFYLPAKALLRACLAIDSYVNVLGSKVDPDWESIDEASTHIKDRLTRIFNNLGKPIDFNRGIWENVLLLFSLREDLEQFELASIYGMQESVVPAIFKVIEQRYPIRLTHAIAEEAIETLLNLSD